MTKTLDAFDEETWSDDERYYFEMVDESLRGARNVLISNGKPQHAAYLIEKFFRHAEQAIRLFSGRLSRTYDGVSVYTNPHIISAAEHLVSRSGHKLTVVIEKELDVEQGQQASDHPLAQMATRAKNEGRLRGLLEIRKASQDAVDFLRERRYCHHWMLMDDRAYRLETSPEDISAHVNFGDAATTGALLSIFDGLLYPGSEELITICG